MIVGHGVRERSVVDLLRTAVDVVLRRYRCRRCTAVMTVGPAELSPRRRYTLGAIALALSLWSLLETAGHQVRARVSAQRRIGDGSLGRWPVLRRWAGVAPQLFAVTGVDASTHREVAAAVCRAVDARAPPDARSLTIVDRAVSGAVGRRVEATCTMPIPAV
jgi:ribosomal protein L40E